MNDIDKSQEQLIEERRAAPLRLLIVIAVSIFVAEAFVMLLLSTLPPFSAPVEAFIDALLLSALVFPILYFFLFRPLLLRITEYKQMEHDIGERLKELKCLYSISQISERVEISLDEVCQEVANLLPPGWHYPEITCSRITVNEDEFRTENYRDTEWKQYADIKVRGVKTGMVEVGYLEERPAIDEGPFLKEERALINAVAEHLSGIIQRKQAEEALRASEKWLSTTLRSIGDAVIATDAKGYVTLMNPVAQTLTGWSEEDATGKPLKDVFNIINEVTGKQAENPVTRVIREGVVVGLANHTVLIAKDRMKWSIDDSGAPIRNGKGNITGVILVFRDITERKQAEENLRKAAEEWRTTFDSITDLVSIVDKDFKLLRVNKAFAGFVNMKPKELIGKTCYKVLHGTEEPWPGCPHKQTMKTGKPVTEEYFEPHLGVYLQVSTSPIFNGMGEAIGSVHIARDITEHKKNEEKLIVTDRLASVGELASGIAHELNNPLTSVIGFSQLLLEKNVPDDVREDVEIIHREAQRTAEVIRNLLTFAQKHEPSKQPVNVNDIVGKVLELRAYEQKVNNIRVVTHLAPDLPQVMADFFQLEQVFLNIIINAEHFMTEAHNGGALTITTEKVDGVIKVSFADDGPGISKENLGHLFDPFFTTKEVGKGTGLGLSICHGVITEHGGQIYAQSEPGQGATFIVELPIQ